MVYCPKCGTKNEDTAEFCANCGASLKTGTVASRRYERRKAEQECFGLPNGGLIAAVVIGVIIIIWGVSMLSGYDFGGHFWYMVLIIIGVLMVVGAIYRSTRSKTTL